MRSLLMLFASLLIATPALAAKPHSHGLAELEVGLEGDTLSVTLESPLDNLLGFEHAPRGEKDFAKVREMAALLRAGDKLFVPAQAAGCTLVSVTLVSAAIAPELLGEKSAPLASTADAHGHEHADLDASYRFKCSKPDALKSLDAAIFGHFERMRFINVQVAAGKVQRAAKLSGQSRRISW